MAAVGAEVTSSWLLSSGVVGFFVLLVLLSIFLVSLCSDCGRRSFELQDSKAEKNPSALIKVVKLEDAMMARENPMINEIRNDEKEIHRVEENKVQVSAWSSHSGAPQINQELKTEEENSVQFTPWRSHLTGVNSFTSPHHLYQTIEGEHTSSADGDGPSPATNHTPRSAAVDDSSKDSVYAQVNKKVAQTTPTATVHTPEQVQEEEEEEEETSPPLPGRATKME